MNGKQDWMAGKIDRAKEQTTRAKVKPARAMQIRMEARMDLRKNLARYDAPAERAAYLEDSLDMIGESLHPLLGRVEAATAFNKRATDVCAFLRVGNAVARARAEQLFAKPANEDHANDGDA